MDPEEEQPKRKYKRNPDLGKMKALHDAGWTYKAISDEMKVPYSTVYNTLNYKMGEQ